MPKGSAHTDKSFEQELTELRELLLSMAGQCERMLVDSMKALSTMDRDSARAIIEEDQDIDQAEIEIDSRCLDMLARRQPVARDLRFITTAMKLVTDLERVGDLVADMCWVLVDSEGDFHAEQGLVTQLMDLGEAARELLRDALDAFVAEDPVKAREVIPRDREINKKHGAIHKQALEHIAGEAGRVDRCFGLLSISRRLERIGDHAKNIAEQVIFMVKGQDIRHGAANDNPG